MKKFIQRALQRVLGFDNYLFVFSVFAIRRIRFSRCEQDFLFFLENIPAGGVILDIGANIGITSIPLAQRHKNTMVYSFEPVPQNVKALKRVARFFRTGNIKIFEYALGEEPANLKMIIPVINKVKMQGLSHIAGSNDDPQHGIVFDVPVKRLDEVDELNNVNKIAAVKIDVENFEYFVLKGGRQLIMKHMPLIYCELWDNDKRDLTIELLEQMGYSTKIFDGKSLVSYKGQKNVINYFFVQPDAA